MKKQKHLINSQIRFEEVRLVGDNIIQGVYSLSEAKGMAEEQGVDLVMISDKSTPPICRVVDYKKFLYDTEKKQKGNKSAQLKEVKLSPNIGDHDLDFKSKNAAKFLEEGSKVKLTLEFKGREMMFKTQGELTLLKFIEKLSEFGIAESLPKLDGKKMVVFIKPK